MDVTVVGMVMLVSRVVDLKAWLPIEVSCDPGSKTTESRDVE